MDYAGTDIRHLLEQAVNEGASDIFVVAGLPITWRVNGRIHHMDGEKLMPSQTEEYVKEIYSLAGGRDMERLTGQGDDDFFLCTPRTFPFPCECIQAEGLFVRGGACDHLRSAGSGGH